MCAAFQPLVYHPHIKQKLDHFQIKNCIPNLLFHGNSGTGKRSLVYQYIYQIYEGNKEKLKTNVMFVNCAHGKGIKFIENTHTSHHRILPKSEYEIAINNFYVE